MYWPKQLIVIIALLSLSFIFLAADLANAPAATMHASGRVQVNHAYSRSVTTLFPGDSVQTDGNSRANLIAGGSSVLVSPSASVIFMGNMVELMQGEMTIATSAGMAAIVDGVTITPGDHKQSKFEVSETEDSILIAAQQGNLSVNDGQQTSTVPEGQETTRKKKAGGEVPPAASGGIRLSKRKKILLAAFGVAGLTAIGFEVFEDGEKCLSSSGDKKCKCEKDDGKIKCEKDDD
jgi:hypothetical protein